MAASTIGVSALLIGGVTGVASASDHYDFTFSTNPDDSADQSVAAGGTLDVPAGYCSLEWSVLGGAGGSSDQGGDDGVLLTGTTPLDRTHTTFGLFPGTMGADGSDGGAGGTNGRTAERGADGTADSNGDFGGGGGAASTVVHGAGVFLSAPGGRGSDPAAGTGGGAGGGTQQLQPGVTAGTDYGDGVISGTAIACPGAPKVNWVEGGDHSLRFQLDSGSLPDGVDITGVQYSLDGGGWTGVHTDVAGGYQYSGEITQLTQGRTYSVTFRFTTTDVVSDVSDATSAAPAGPAPTQLAATVSGGLIHISWAPPTDPTGVVGYSAWVLPGAQPQSSNGLVECPAMDASARGCTLVVPAGTVYSVSVVALSPDRGQWATVVSDVVPAPTAPATVPAGSGTLSTPSGAPSALAQGGTVTLTGTGYAPNSTVSLYIYSTPTLLATVQTDGTGSFSKAVTIPANLAPGAHHLVSAGVDPSGNPRYLTSAVTVAQATGTLAWTGFETLPVLLGGVLTVAVGAGLVLVGRRRRTA